MRLLNGEEIDALDVACGMSEIDGTEPYHPKKYEHTLLKAQYQQDLKDFIEWFEKRNILVLKDGKKIRGVPDEDWQNFLKQLVEE